MTSDRDDLRFAVLGPVRAWRGEAELRLGPPQQRATLALLLAQAGQPVSLDALVDGLWRQDPPASAVNVVHRYVGTLRRLFEPELPVRAPGRRLRRSAGGYLLDVDAESCDLLQFRQLVGRAGAAGDDAARVELFAGALGLCRGPVADGIEADVRAGAIFTALDQEYRDAVLAAAEAALRAGASPLILPRVRRAAAEHPLDEPLHARLMAMLAATGRPADALETYGAVRARLAEELGVDPGPEMVAAHERILRGERSEPDPPARRPPPRVEPPTVRPAQLPVDLAAFTGRTAELGEVLSLLTDASAVVISAVGGMAGIGKTTLAVHWAHQVADRFPDGQLYLNLRGFGPGESVVTPAQAIRYFLDAFAVPQARIPAGLDAQAALYRSLVSGRRVLIVLDNARDVEQVRPLLPGSPTCFTLVTSRNTLTELVVTQGAHFLTLGPLPDGTAREFLRRRLGAARVDADPAAVATIVRACAGLPLGLAIVAARAATRPGFPLAAIAAELSAAHGTLRAFGGLDESADPSALFSWSYRALTPVAARMFRLLGQHPGPSVDGEAAARTAALDDAAAGAALAELTRAHLLSEVEPGRFAFHDLLRAYAAGLADDAEREPALRRLLGHYRRTAAEAIPLFAPLSLSVSAAEPWRTGDRFADREQAAGWLAEELPALLAAQRLAGGLSRAEAAGAGPDGFGAFAGQLGRILDDYLDMCGRWDDWAESQRLARDVAHRAGDPAAEAEACRSLGLALSKVGRPDEAQAELERALSIVRGLGDTSAEAKIHRAYAYALGLQERFGEALRHAQAAMRLYRPDDRRRANPLNDVGWFHALLGQFPQALENCSQALRLMREQRAGERSIASVLDSLGYIERHLGHPEQARANYRQAADLRRAYGDRYPLATTLLGLGAAEAEAGDTAAATAARKEALEILEDLGRPEAAEVRARLAAVH